MAEDEGRGAAGREAWGLLGELMMARRHDLVRASFGEGLTPPHAFMLLRLREDDPPHMRELAEHLHCDPSYVTTLADRLEERGFAERRLSPDDRRLKAMVLTPAGREAQARIKAALMAPPAGLTELPEEDQQTLLRIARTLADATRGTSGSS